MNNQQYKKKLVSIIIAYAAIGLVYIFATPPLEASDEYKHYPVVQYIQTQAELPVLDPENPGLWLQEGAQPPLYYQLMAAITFWIDSSDLETVHHKNEHAFIGNPNQIHNKNIILHDREAEQFPWSGSILAIYIIRLASLALGGLTVLVTARLGKLMFTPAIGLLAAILTAFNPMFLFVQTAVNNDSLANLLGAVGLYLLVALWQTMPDPRKKWWIYVRLGIVLGLGLLTKLSLGGLLGLAGLALAWQAWRQRRWQLFFIGGPLILFTALAISAYWFARNMQLYGDLTGLSAFIAVQGTRDNPITLMDWVQEFGTFYRSYWGLFGGVNVLAPNWLYVMYNALFVVGFVSFFVQFFKNRAIFWQKGVGLVLAWIILLFLLLVRWNIISPAFQGRLLFPALSGINVLWAAGVMGLLSLRGRERGQRTILPIAIAGGLIAVFIALFAIRPAYAYPKPLKTAVIATLYEEPITFTNGDDVIQLIGADVAPDQSVLPADQPVKVTLYWQAVTDIENSYLSTVHLLGREWESVGDINRYPAWGMVPTDQWQAGQIWQDDYHIYVNENAEVPTRLRIKASLYDPETGDDLSATVNGTMIDPVLVGEARLGAEDAVAIAPAHALDFQFEEGIGLTGYTIAPATVQAGDEVELAFFWAATAQPSRPYTVFVQLRDADGNQVGSADAPPLNNDYPTNLWRTGDRVIDLHILHVPADLPAGAYAVAVGLYDPETGIRLNQQEGGNEVLLPFALR